MKTQYKVMRFHQEIFRGSLGQVKRFLISKPAFANYKKRIRRAKNGDAKCGGGWNKSLSGIACETEYCAISIIDNREKLNTIEFSDYSVTDSNDVLLNVLIDKQRENFKSVLNQKD